MQQLKRRKCQQKINNTKLIMLLIFLFALILHFLIISKFIFEISDRIQLLEQKSSDDYFERMQEIKTQLRELSRDTIAQRENMLILFDQEAPFSSQDGI
jgi:flagellar biosynthesis/type III secretory pathway M-ring protein FliF/YscJ